MRVKTVKGIEMRKLWVAVWLALVPAHAFAGQPVGGEARDITVQTPWIRYLLPSVPAGGYLTLHNNSDTPASLTAVSSPACGALMLHQSMNMGGTAMMVPVTSIPIPAHGQAELVEGGYHMMCMKPDMKVGGMVDITLTFADGSTLLVKTPVYGPAGAP